MGEKRQVFLTFITSENGGKVDSVAPISYDDFLTEAAKCIRVEESTIA
jgi:hypothetical protein